MSEIGAVVLHAQQHRHALANASMITAAILEVLNLPVPLLTHQHADQASDTPPIKPQAMRSRVSESVSQYACNASEKEDDSHVRIMAAW